MLVSRYHASCAKGLEPQLASELSRFGASDIEVSSRGVEFEGEARVGYAAVVNSRLATRVSEVLARGECRTADDLYALGRSVRWRDIITPDQTLRVETRVGERVPRGLDHSHFSSLTLKNAVVDELREKVGSRPSIDTNDPDLPLGLYLHRGDAIIARALSSHSLHKRGYRAAMHKAALKETLAAGCLAIAGVGSSHFVDPMCGSGTLAIEAALGSREIAPGLLRLGLFGDAVQRGGFAVQRWRDLDRDAWDAVVADALARVRPAPARVFASDAHPAAVALAKRDARAAGVADDIDIRCRDVHDAPRSEIVVSNPPWDVRIGAAKDAWQALGHYLKATPGAAAFLLSGNMPLTRELRLRTTTRWRLQNAGIDLHFLRYDVYPPP
ncbi:hypothetical protein CTAYLR_005582 [Chrysophaeum taylorii]|uniref:THUMP domain-containing protein n=1 Tax=Chrysophaeum taylorii TaxID=2483200 RepID=A0AAD7XH78_9STRA|nr:hypothetical protein CTAYLR_005582 [Chrysophaeum taylorii]